MKLLHDQLRILFLVAATLISGLSPAQASQNTVLILGDSLSAAYGVQTEQAWVALLRQRLAQQGLAQWQVVNASISGETTDGGLRRLPDLLSRHTPDVVVIELGGNDGLRGFPPPVIEQNLDRLISLSLEAGARPLLIGIQIPPNYGPRYTALFADIYSNLADRHDIALVPFFLKGIYDQAGMMQGDGIHPTTEAQGTLLDNVWPQLEALLVH
ncbi:arylesterase [Marinobacter mobilis]|uniref:Acyl-CoA thioesterase-1 n=1 Tax=Marinobacter mobilis TaxID=488533 RepID=A0A1H2ZC02_9GAMM|nr:arylesterase [Marinobacter mobilis]SDX14279.1 acyl-CoA thioesterase-1 [Marinobacter mobilis]